MSSRIAYPSEHSYTLTMQPMKDGTRLSDCRVSIKAYVSTNKSVDIDSSWIRKIDDDSIEIIIVMEDMIKIGKGQLKLSVNVGIPDTNFPDGFRNQKYEVWMD